MMVSLYTSRVILNTLGVEDFGIYNVVGGVVTMFSFLNGAMSSATQRYFTFGLGKGDKIQLKKVFSTTISIHGLISVVIILLAETIGLWFLMTQMTIPSDRMSGALWVYQFSVLACVVMVMSVPYNAAIIAHEKMSAFAYISILEVALKLFIVYLLVVFSFDKLKLYAVLMFSVQMIVCLAYTRYCGKHFPETKFKFMWDKALFKEMSVFAGWNLCGNLAAVTFTQGVDILLNLFFGPVVNAARGVAIQVQGAINGFSMNFQMALNPQIIKSYAKNDLSYMHSLIFRSSKFSFFLLLLLSLPVLIETKTILTLWLNIVPDYTVSFVRIMLCITLVDSIGSPLMVAAQATGKIRFYQTVVGGVLLLILPFSYLCLKLGAMPEVVFLVHLLMVVIAQIVRLYIVQPLIKLSMKQYFYEIFMKIVYVTFLSILLPLVLYNFLPDNWWRFFLVCFSCLISVSIISYFVGLTLGERNVIKAKIITSYQMVIKYLGF